MSATLGHSAALLTTLGDCHLPPFWSASAVTYLSPPAPPPPPPLHRLPATPPPPPLPKPLAAATSATLVNQRLNTTATASLPLACSNCRLPILQRQYLCLNDGRPWHAECLLCSQCRHPLAMESRCYVREGRVYCKYDYQR
ncbi:LIM/homeobox protein Lhx2 [Sparganum proliferum]